MVRHSVFTYLTCFLVKFWMDQKGRIQPVGRSYRKNNVRSLHREIQIIRAVSEGCECTFTAIFLALIGAED